VARAQGYQHARQRVHISTKWLLGEIVVIGIILTLLNMLGHPLLLPYQWHKLLHIVGAILLVGNIIVTAVWLVLAEQSRNAATLHFAAKAVMWADVFFTAPGILLLLANGQILAQAAWGGMRESWIVLAFGLFVLSGIVWIGFLVRLQHRLIQLSGQAVGAGGSLSTTFFRALHAWHIAGMVATVSPILSLFLMVVKPTVW
jgi:uncharacterized membrane protein